MNLQQVTQETKTVKENGVQDTLRKNQQMRMVSLSFMVRKEEQEPRFFSYVNIYTYTRKQKRRKYINQIHKQTNFLKQKLLKKHVKNFGSIEFYFEKSFGMAFGSKKKVYSRI